MPLERTLTHDRRSAGLDVLRFVAVMLVLGRHLQWPSESLPWVMAVWQRGGWVGVDLFFVLSGFLVAGLLFTEYQKTRKLSWERFYVRRWWKIYPPFAVMLLASVIVAWWTDRPVDGRVLVEAVFVQNYAPGLWPHTWSLAVEEHFYLVLPPLLTALLAMRPSRPFGLIVPVGLAMSVACVVLRVITWHEQPSYSHQTHLFPTHLRIDSLFVGVALAYVYHFRRELVVRIAYPWRHSFLAVGASCFLPAFILTLESSVFLNTVGFTLFSIGSALLVVGAVVSPPTQRSLVRGMATLGAYSYSVYLWHMPVAIWLMPHLGAVNLPLHLGLYVTGTFAVGMGMARLVEVPALRLRDRLFPSVAGARPLHVQVTT